MNTMIWLLFISCQPTEVDEKESQTEADTDTGVETNTEDEMEIEIYSIEEGNYLVESIETLPNDCEADWSYMADRILPIVYIEGGISIADVPVLVDDNDLSGTDEQEMDWSGLGQDCTTNILDVFGGSLTSHTSLVWEWESTWEYVSGDTCYEALGHELPCTYTGVFQLIKVDEE